MRSSLVALGLILLAGCNPAASVDATPDAKALVDRYLAALREQRYDDIMAMYDEQFWQGTSRDDWRKVLPNIERKLGKLKDCELRNWGQRTQINTAGSGNFVDLSYTCHHEKYTAVLSFTIFKPLSGGASTIIAENINSMGFLIE